MRAVIFALDGEKRGRGREENTKMRIGLHKCLLRVVCVVLDDPVVVLCVFALLYKSLLASAKEVVPYDSPSQPISCPPLSAIVKQILPTP